MIIGGCASICVLAWPTIESATADFRVETSIFLGDDSDPVDQRITVFEDGKVFDFAKNGTGNAYMLNTVAGELTILDPSNGTSARVSVNELARFVAEQTTRLDKMPEAVREKLVPRLTSTWDSPTNTLRLAGRGFSYTAKLQQPSQLASKPGDDQDNSHEEDVTIATRYRRFTDCLARFNSIHPPAMPPQSRLRLNHEIAERDSVPVEIVRTREAGVTRSTHAFYDTLRVQDKQRCRAIRVSIPDLQSLGLRDFLIR